MQPHERNIQRDYQTCLESMSGTERVARAMTMLRWTREMLARQVVAELGEMSSTRLRWEVASRLYGADESLRAMIENELTNVSR